MLRPNDVTRFLSCLVATSLLAGMSPAQEAPARLDEGASLLGLHRITAEGEKSGEGYFSPDGRTAVYQSVQEGCPHYQIYMRSLAGGPPTMISTGKGLTTCAFFHPNQDTILFASTHLDPETFGPPPENRGRYVWNKHTSFDIFTVRPGTEGLTRLTDAPGYDAEGAYSPDGSRIVFCSERDGDYEIYTMRSDGTDVRRVTRSPGYDGGPFFSPDGTKICFRGFRDPRPEFGRYAQVFIVDADGRNERQLTFNTAVNWAPYFHPSGDYLVYCTNVDGERNFELILLRLSDARIVRLTTDPGADVMPVFSPDGKKLMWTSTRFGGRSELVIADFVMPTPDAFGEPLRDAADPAAGAHEQADGAAGHAQETGEHRERQAAQGETSSAHAPTTRPSATTATLPAAARVTRDECELHVRYLASDELTGRRPGTEGCEKAAAYIEKELAALGLEPAGSRGFRHEFELTVGSRLGATNGLSLAHVADGTLVHRVLPVGEEWTPLSFSADGEAAGNVVFVGYGVTTPDGKWDDYAGVDATGKIALCFLRGAPELPADPHDPHSSLALYTGSRYKAFNAARHGATGIIFVADSRQRDQDGLTPLGIDGGKGREKIPAIQLKRSVAHRLFASAGPGLDELEAALAKADHPVSRVLGRVEAQLSTSVEVVTATTANVVARLPGRDPALAADYIVVGAHYDHLGHGGSGSLAPGGGVGQIHNGADDNASGVGGIIELAERFVHARPRRSVLIVAFSGEEEGLLGSAAWMQHPSADPEHCVAMINLDMVGRYGADGLTVDGVGTAAEWRGLLDGARAEGFKVAMTEGSIGGGRSDHASFISGSIPALHFFTGAHEDYHRPSDDWDRCNYEGMVEVVEYIGRVIEALDARDGRIAFTKPKTEERTQDVSSSGYGAWLGTIPSYQEESGGVTLSGVSPGSPAETTGLRAGDVLVLLGDFEIDNIYDFTNALRSLRPGDTIAVHVRRAGELVELKTTLARR